MDGFVYPTRASLADALRRVMAAGITLDGVSDHGVSEALYLRDPDKNGIELYWDKPRELWPVDAKGHLQMYSKRLDLDNLLKEITSDNLSETDIRNQRMRLQALSRWENEGGGLPEPDASKPNPEEIHR